jgi:aryl-alcohol dehydrogenase-like predicted oxidoreductase
MSRLALGTVQFGMAYGIANHVGQVTRRDANLMLRLAERMGIDTIDTAIAYGDSEACLGEAGVQNFKVVTKLPKIPDDCGDVSAWVQQQVAGSCARLGVSALYGLLLHHSDNLVGTHGAELYQAIQNLKDIGQVEKMGVSIYSPDELDAIGHRFRLDLVQAPFNIIDRRLLTSGWLQRLNKSGVEVHTRSVFLQGLLLMPRAGLPDKFSPWQDVWLQWFDWLSSHDASAAEACMAFPLSFAEVDRVVIGAVSLDQLTQINQAANLAPLKNFPDFLCHDERLINPAHWPQL